MFGILKAFYCIGPAETSDVVLVNISGGTFYSLLFRNGICRYTFSLALIDTVIDSSSDVVVSLALYSFDEQRCERLRGS